MPRRALAKSWDEEKGPKLVFSDPDPIDLPRRHGRRRPLRHRAHPLRRGLLLAESRLWPVRRQGDDGQCARSSKAPDLFDPRRIRLADIDGSGNADIIYVGHDGISLYFNQSGNSWSPPHRLAHFPRVDNLTLDRGDGPAGQRHGLPGVVVAAARRTRAGPCATSI